MLGNHILEINGRHDGSGQNYDMSANGVTNGMNERFIDTDTPKLLAASLDLFNREKGGHMASFAYSRPYNADDPVRGAEDWPKFARHDKYYVYWDDVALLDDQDTSNKLVSLLPKDTKFSLIEPGPGPEESVEDKTHRFINAMHRVHGDDSVVEYTGLDVDAGYATCAPESVTRKFSKIAGQSVTSDFRSDGLSVPVTEGAVPLAIVFGGTLFNLPKIKDAGPEQILQTYLQYMRSIVGTGGYVVITQDVNQDATSLQAAYDDDQGYARKTAKSILHRIERDLKTQNFSGNDFDVEVEWDSVEQCQKYVAVAQKAKRFGIGDAYFNMRKNDRWTLINAFKKSADTFQRCAEFSGFEHVGSVSEKKHGRVIAHVLRVK